MADDEKAVIALERAGWDALATSGDAASSFYDDVLARDVLMLLPGATVIEDRHEVVASMGGAPWDDYELGPMRALTLHEDCIALAYRAAARRGEHRYDAIFCSVYVRTAGDWQLALHQQTPT